MSGAKWACFLGLPTISSYILLYFVKSIYNPWDRLFLARALYFLHVFIHIHVFWCVFLFFGDWWVSHTDQKRSVLSFFLFCLFVFLFSPLWLLVFRIYTIDQFSQGDMLLPLLTFPTVSLCISQRETSINIWSIRQCEACSLVCSPWREVVYAVCFGWSTSLKLTTLPLMDALFWPVTRAKTPCWSISSKLRLQASSLITHTCRNVLAQLLTNLTVVRARTCANTLTEETFRIAGSLSNVSARLRRLF